MPTRLLLGSELIHIFLSPRCASWAFPEQRAERPEEAFGAWVEELRSHDGLRNDDVTLLVVDFQPVDTKPAHAFTE